MQTKTLGKIFCVMLVLQPWFRNFIIELFPVRFIHRPIYISLFELKIHIIGWFANISWILLLKWFWRVETLVGVTLIVIPKLPMVKIQKSILNEPIRITISIVTHIISLISFLCDKSKRNLSY